MSPQFCYKLKTRVTLKPLVKVAALSSFKCMAARHVPLTFLHELIAKQVNLCCEYLLG